MDTWQSINPNSLKRQQGACYMLWSSAFMCYLENMSWISAWHSRLTDFYETQQSAKSQQDTEDTDFNHASVNFLVNGDGERTEHHTQCC